jgi:preprotein translocase subunit SecE
VADESKRRRSGNVVKKEAKQEPEKVDKQSSPKNDASVASVKDASAGFGVGSFIEGTKEEFGKVVWPSRQQLISESVAVILMVGLSATLISLVDKLFGWASKQVF